MKDYTVIKAEVEKEYPETCEMLKDLLEEEYKLFINIRSSRNYQIL